MALTGALFTGVTGINANGNAMNVIGDNIANVNTVGFKSSRATFFDLLSADVGGLKVGSGTRLASSDRIFTQGGIETTNNPTDLAVEGSGFFVLRNNVGTQFFSRAGEFHLDADGVLVNPEGLKVQGIQLDSSGNPISGLSDIVIDSKFLVSPTPTTMLNITVNLDATATTPTAALPADASGTVDLPANWFAGANFSTVVTIYDSLGAAHDLTLVFRKAAANQWEYRVLANAGEITGGTAGQLQQIGNAGGILSFNSDGTFNSGAPTNITAIGPVAWANGASPQTITAANLQLGSSTQFALPSAVNVATQDGVQSGTVQSIRIGKDGVITGLFSSARTIPLYRIALADFSNPQGLTHYGTTLFQESADSGQALFNSPGEAGYGNVLSGSLELSTVDLATEFVKMITTQRGFQASSRTITVTDTLLEELVNITR